MASRGRGKRGGGGGRGGRQIMCPSYPGVNVLWGLNNVNCGPLKEFPEISIDRFYREEDLKAEAFFLTHAHTDHMVGLEGPAFHARLAEKGVTLYMHPLTGIMLSYPDFRRYQLTEEQQPSLVRRKKLVLLDVKKPKVLSLSGGRKVTVTPLPAEHCPGSVMYLFESGDLRVLYTGDFRLTLSDWKNLQALHDQDGRLRPLSHLYIDTTFCSMEYGGMFPDRIAIEDKAFSRLKHWLSQDGDRWVYITFAAKFAHEYFLYKLHQNLGLKIHITPEKLRIYEEIGPLRKVFTLDGRSTPFHYCGNKQCRGDQRLFMKLSSMWFLNVSQNENEEEDFSYPEIKRQRDRIKELRNAVLKDENVVRMDAKERNFQVCYAMHPSRQEVVEAIDYLKPRMVTPLVMPFSSVLNDVREALKQNCRHSFLYEDYHSTSEFIQGKGLKKTKKLKRSASFEEKLQQVLNSARELPPEIGVQKIPAEEIEVPIRTTNQENRIPTYDPITKPYDFHARRKRFYRLLMDSDSSSSDSEETLEATVDSPEPEGTNCKRRLVSESQPEAEICHIETASDIESKSSLSITPRLVEVPAEASTNIPEVITLDGSSDDEDTDFEMEMEMGMNSEKRLIL